MDPVQTDAGTKVLVVDDSLTIRQQVRAALSAEHYTVLEAADGVAALEIIGSTPGIDVIICDVNMPRMDGLELLTRLQAADNTTPVVMLTTEGQPELIQQARSEGARGWMVKPFKPDILVKAIDRLASTS